MTEFLPWYQSGATLMRCDECGALVISDETNKHADWHEMLRVVIRDAADLPGPSR